MSLDEGNLGTADGVAKPEKRPRGQTRSSRGSAHSWQKRRILKRDLCLKARPSSRGHSALRSAQFPRPRDGESHSRRTYRAIPRNGTAPGTEMPRREGLAFQDVGGNGLSPGRRDAPHEAGGLCESGGVPLEPDKRGAGAPGWL